MTSLSIRARLMLSVGLSVLILVTLNGFFNYQKASSNLKDSVSEILTRTGDNTSRFVNNWFVVKSQIVTGAAEALKLGNKVDDVVRQGQLAGKFEVMYVGEGNGRMLTFPPLDLPGDYDPRTRPWYTQAVQANKQIVTPPYQDASGDGQKIVMTFAEPVGNDVVGADVELGAVVKEILGVKIGESGYAALIDGQGNFLVHPNPNKVGKPLTTGRSLTRTPSDIAIDGKDWIGAAFPIDGVDWKLLLIMEKSDALSGLGDIAFSNVIVSAITISIVVLVCGFMISKLLAPLMHLNQAMSNISAGDADLTKRLDVRNDDEVGLLSHSFNNFVSAIHNLVSDSLSSTQALTSLSDSAKNNAKENNAAIQIQQSEIGQVAAAINEMSVTSSQVATSASDTAAAAEKAAEEGGKGMQIAKENTQYMAQLTEQIDQTTITINQLDSQAQQINTILSTIQGIAEQTNLLALNAAIEAARAGEQGRGFAVVADEVRALSGRTHQATEEIQVVMKELQGQTQNAVSIMEASKELTEKTGASAGELTNNLMHIAEAVEDISIRATTIANASKEQYTATEEINRIATAIHDASNKLAENVDQSTRQSDELHSLSSDIDTNLSRFQV